MMGANQSLQDSILVDNFCNFLLIAQYCPFMMGLSGNSQDYHTMCPRCENSCCNKEHTHSQDYQTTVPESLGAGPSFHTIRDTKRMKKLDSMSIDRIADDLLWVCQLLFSDLRKDNIKLKLSAPNLLALMLDAFLD